MLCLVMQKLLTTVFSQFYRDIPSSEFQNFLSFDLQYSTIFALVIGAKSPSLQQQSVKMLLISVTLFSTTFQMTQNQERLQTHWGKGKQFMRISIGWKAGMELTR